MINDTTLYHEQNNNSNNCNGYVPERLHTKDLEILHKKTDKASWLKWHYHPQKNKTKQNKNINHGSVLEIYTRKIWKFKFWWIEIERNGRNIYFFKLLF